MAERRSSKPKVEGSSPFARFGVGLSTGSVYSRDLIPYTLSAVLSKNMFFKSLIAASVSAATLAAPAMAGGLQGSYVGAGPSINLNGGNVGGSIVGRVQIDKQPASIRPQLIIQQGVAGVVTGTYDIPAGDGVNVYVGAGVGYGNAGGLLTANSDVVGVAQLGVEGQVAPQVVLFADMKFGFGSGTTYVPTIGAAYKF